MDRNDLVRDVYAHFGLALYNAQVLEHGLANAMAFAAMASNRLSTVEDYDAFLAQRFERTLGTLIKELHGHIEVDPALQDLLQIEIQPSMSRLHSIHRHARRVRSSRC